MNMAAAGSLPQDLSDRALATEHFVLRWLDGVEVPATHREDWLLD